MLTTARKCTVAFTLLTIATSIHLLLYSELIRTALKDIGLLDQNKVISKNITKNDCCKKVLIWWKRDNARSNHGYGGVEGPITCPQLNNCCVLVTYAEDIALLQLSDIVIFHASQHTELKDYGMFQAKRFKEQLWVWQTWESPIRAFQLLKKRPPSWFHFNITMTFRWGSDIRVPYGSFETFPQITSNHLESQSAVNWAYAKTKLIAWVAHNCNSTTWARFKFVQNLQRQIPVDIYGRCGNLSCPGWNTPCDAIKQYKFFLALENSECKDYITEKFWWWPFVYDLNIIPIVYGAPKGDYDKVAPPNSFIHLSDFNSIEEFVDYIHILDYNDSLYNKYFEWKRIGYVRKGNDYFTHERICSLFQVKPLVPSRGVYDKWWIGSCTKRRKDWQPLS